MRCPQCDSGLVKMHYENVQVDYCKECKGVWLDSDEMNDVVDDLVSKDRTKNAVIDLDKLIVGEVRIKENHLCCPKCAEAMTKFNYAYDSNIILDKCESCNGIWTDYNEVMRLAVFRKGNPVLNRMGAAIAKDRGESLNNRYSDSSSSMSSSSPWYTGIGLRIIIPIGDDQERNTFPFVVVGIILLNVLIFLFQSFYFQGDAIRSFYFQFGLVPSSAFSSVSGGYSFLTSMFIHGSLWHLLGNMLFLWIFADNIEDRLGHFKFILIYLVCGLSADFLHVALNQHSQIPCIGASGAISGMMGAYFVLYPAAKIKTIVYGAIMDIPALVYLAGWLGFQIFFAVMESGRSGGGVAWLAHIGGFAAGAAVGFIARFASKMKEKHDIYHRPEKTVKTFDPKSLS